MPTFGSLGTTFPFKDLSPRIDALSILENGKFVQINFNVADNVICPGERAYFHFTFNAPFLHSSSPLLCTTDYTRTNHQYLSKVCQYSRAVDAQLVKNGVNIRFESVGENGTKSIFQDSYPAWFLFAFAPYTATLTEAYPQRVQSLLEKLESDPLATNVASTGDISLLNYYAQHDQRPMSRYPVGHPENVLGHEYLPEPPIYNYDDLYEDIHLLRQLIYDISVNPGFAFIYNVKPPHAYDDVSVLEETYYFMHKLFGKPNQHPARNSQVFNMTKKVEVEEKAISHDYDLDFPLSMHTDSVLYASTHAFLQTNYQTVSDCHTCLADGFACADYMKQKYPEYYEMLCKVPVTYGIRHQFYTIDGLKSNSKRNMDDLRAKRDEDDFFESELINTKPAITEYEGIHRVYDENGNVSLQKKTIPIQVCHSASKAGVSAIHKDDFDLHLKAIEKWQDVIEGREEGIRGAHYPDIEWPQDTMLMFNNHRMLHGRATIVNPGIQNHIHREVNRHPAQPADQGENSKKVETADDGPPIIKGASKEPSEKHYAKAYVRQMIGAHQHRVNTDNQLRFLEMKILEEKLKHVELEVSSEFDGVQKPWFMKKGNDVLASWLPRCPTKVLERLLVGKGVA